MNALLDCFNLLIHIVVFIIILVYAFLMDFNLYDFQLIVFIPFDIVYLYLAVLNLFHILHK